MTWTNATQDLKNDGATGLPIGNVRYNGAAANAQEAADLIQVISAEGEVFQSTHPTDIVGIWLGGNPATGNENEGSFPKSHSSYTGYLPSPGAYIQVGDDKAKRVNLREITDQNWGLGNFSVPVYVPPTKPKSPKNEVGHE